MQFKIGTLNFQTSKSLTPQRGGASAIAMLTHQPASSSWDKLRQGTDRQEERPPGFPLLLVPAGLHVGIAVGCLAVLYAHRMQHPIPIKPAPQSAA